MALKLGSLIIDIITNTKSVDDAEDKVIKKTGSMEKAFNRVGAAILAAFSVEAARKVVLIADEMSVLERRIGRISDNSVQAAKNFRELSRIATQTGQKIANVARVFEGFKRIQGDIGATNDELLTFTESLNRLAIVGGSSAEETANALRQLNQGLAGGIVRAEEFNSIIENTPEIAFAIATGLGKSVGELRQMVLDGELLSENVFGAILSQTEEINKAFSETPQSLAQAFQGAANEMSIFISQLNDAVGLTQGLSEIFAKFRDNLAEINRRNADASKSDIKELERRLQAQDKLTMSIRNSIIFFKKSIAEQQKIIDTKADTEEAERKIKVLSASLAKSLENQKFSIGESEKIYQRILAIKQKEKEVSDAIVESERQRNTEAQRAADLSAARSTATVGSVDRASELLGMDSPSRPGSRRGTGRAMADTSFVPDEDQDKFAQFLADLGNTNEQIEQEALRHQQALESITNEGSEARAQGELAIEENKNAQIQQMQAAQLANAGAFFGGLNSLLIQSGKEGTAAQKFAARASAVIQAQQIIAAGEVAAIKAGAATAGGGPLAFMASAGAVRGFAAARAGLVLGMNFGGGRRHGGEVSGNLAHEINESGDPEVFVQGSKQFLLPGGKGGRVVSGSDMQGGNSTGVNVTIINQVPGVVVEQQSVSMQEVIMLVKKAENSAVARVDQSISTNQGSTSRALDQAGVSRRI
jgi:tape measure domain-containing protein